MDLLNLFPKKIKNCLKEIDFEPSEIRVGIGKPIILVSGEEERFLKLNSNDVLMACKEDMEYILACAAEHSMYLKEDEVNKGFISAIGGVRIGVCGSVSYKDGEIVHHGDITSINVRIPKEVRGFGFRAADVFCRCEKLSNMLIVSSPGKGKTTLLRDVIRILSDVKRCRVGVVDERYELFGSGAFNLGIRSDVLCGCKKSDGMMMLIRSMTPQIIAVDELGSGEEITAVKEASRCGVRVIATVHGGEVDKELLSCFDILVRLNKIGEYEITGGEY